MKIARLLADARLVFTGNREHVSQDAYVDAVITAIAYAGPPLAPIDWYSENVTETIVKSASGHALFVASSWLTYPWTCVRFDVPSVPMGRPVLIPTDDGTLPTLRLDHRSATFQRRLTAALQALGVSGPNGRCVVHNASSPTASFIAWRDLDPDVDGDPATLPGDVDNYAKNVLDGMQRAGLLRNDRLVARLSAIKATVAEFGTLHTLTERLHAAALQACPKAAKATESELDQVRKTIGATRAQMHAWFPHYPPVRSGRRRSGSSSGSGSRKPGRPKGSRHIDPRLEQVLALANDDTAQHTVGSIAADTGVNRNTITKWLKQANISLLKRRQAQRKAARAPTTTHEKREEVLRIFRENPTLTTAEIARLAHVNRSVANTVLAELPERQAATHAANTAKRKAAIELHAANPSMSFTQIGTRVGAARSSVARWIREKTPVV